MIVVLMAAAGLGGILIASRSTIESVHRIESVDAALTSAVQQSTDNYLLVGSDSRANSDPNSPDYGGIGNASQVTGNRSDTIMVLRHDATTGALSLLSIPRDLWVDIPGKGKSRINSAFNDGPAALVKTVQESVGIPIQHYVEVDFSGFKQLVDSIGGVQICFEVPTRDLNTGLDITEPGCYQLDGVRALQYARSRHYEELRNGKWREDGTADIGRTKRQREFISTALNTALAKVKADPFKAGSIISSSASAVGIDSGLDLVGTVNALRPALEGGLKSYALPVVGKTIDGKAVLLLGKGADVVIAYFNGAGPPPAEG
jgi:LCP family protein required for cell wall assembly